MAANSDREILVEDDLVANEVSSDPSTVTNASSRANLVKSPLTNSNITAVFVVTFDTRSGEAFFLCG